MIWSDHLFELYHIYIHKYYKIERFVHVSCMSVNGRLSELRVGTTKVSGSE